MNQSGGPFAMRTPIDFRVTLAHFYMIWGGYCRDVRSHQDELESYNHALQVLEPLRLQFGGREQ